MSRDRTGRLIAFEGIEGAGKSTHIRLAADKLQRSGRRVLVTAEPGGSAIGQQIRGLVLNHRDPAPTPLTELFLYLADRTQHIAEVILPAVSAGEVVLSDRFSASTIAYQGYARGLDLAEVMRADAWARQGISPALNILLDCPVSVGLRRARGDDRFHAEEEAFHQRVREGFLALSDANAEGWRVVDATQSETSVQHHIMQAIGECLRKP